ncbi:MAG: hypothetical protein AMXMBFR37_05800 [Steroidobacteraceae bacterium]
MPSERLLFACDVCGKPYQHGPHRYEGHKLDLYGGIMACGSCWDCNHDGWAPHLERAILGHLDRLGLPVPPRNDNGLLPRN